MCEAEVTCVSGHLKEASEGYGASALRLEHGTRLALCALLLLLALPCCRLSKLQVCMYMRVSCTASNLWAQAELRE